MLIAERRDAVLLLTLSRPEKRNSLHPDLIRDLLIALTHAEADASLDIVVIAGSGSSFCSGLDLNHLLRLDTEGKIAYVRSFFLLFRHIYHLPQPIIAAVNGAAIAGGFDIAAACDLRLCSPEAEFAQTEVLLGITQIMYPIYKVIGLGRAVELALTGEPINAEEAYRIGLVNRIYPADELLVQAMSLAEILASRPRQALLATKLLSRQLIEMSAESAIKRMFESISEGLRSEEHQQQLANYVSQLEKRR